MSKVAEMNVREFLTAAVFLMDRAEEHRKLIKQTR